MKKGYVDQAQRVIYDVGDVCQACNIDKKKIANYDAKLDELSLHMRLFVYDSTKVADLYVHLAER